MSGSSCGIEESDALRNKKEKGEIETRWVTEAWEAIRRRAGRA